MGIRAAIGLGLTIIMVKLLMGEMFSAFEYTLTQFFVLSGDMLAHVSSSL